MKHRWYDLTAQGLIVFSVALAAVMLLSAVGPVMDVLNGHRVWLNVFFSVTYVALAIVNVNGVRNGFRLREADRKAELDLARWRGRLEGISDATRIAQGLPSAYVDESDTDDPPKFLN